MRSGIFAAALLALGGVVLSAPAARAEDPFLESVRAKSEAFYEQFKDITVVQDVDTIQPVTNRKARTVVTTYHKGRKLRRELVSAPPPGAARDGLSLESMKTVIIFDGTDLYLVSPLNGVQKSRPASADIPSEYFGWQFLTPESVLAGYEKIGSRECAAILINSKSSPYTKVWLDRNTAAIVQGEKVSKGIDVRVRQSKFQMMDGWEVPRSSEVVVVGQTAVKSKIRSITVNTGLSDDLFDGSKIDFQPPDLQGVAHSARSVVEAQNSDTNGTK